MKKLKNESNSLDVSEQILVLGSMSHSPLLANDKTANNKDLHGRSKLFVFDDVRERLKKTDIRQRKSLANIAYFLVVMIVLTVVSRGVSSVSLAKVSITVPFAGEIIEEFLSSGVIESSSEFSPEIPSGLKISEILVIPGQHISVNEKIVSFDVVELTSRVNREELSLKKMEINYNKLLRGEPYDGSALLAAQTSLQWAEQDLTNAEQNAAMAIASAQGALNTAESELLSAKEALNSLPDDVSDEDLFAARDRIKKAELDVTEKKTQLESIETTSAANIETCKRALEIARQQYESSKNADAVARQNAADIEAKNRIDAEELLLDINKQKETLSLLNEIASTGMLLSPVSGIVLEISQSSITSETSKLLVIAKDGTKFIGTTSVPQNAVSNLKLGASADIMVWEGVYGNRTVSGAKLLSISQPNELTGYVTMKFDIPDGEWKHGQQVEYRIILKKNTYSCVVPANSLHSSKDGMFVFVIDEKSSVLGLENVVRQVKVTLLASNHEFAAIEGAIASNDKIISNSTKSLINGDKVRILRDV